MDTNLSLAYMAGFFDGEGYIGVIKRKKSEAQTEYFVRISIGQKDGEVMDWVKQDFGGHLYKVKRDNSYTWIATNLAAYEVLKKIVPYLKYKKPQAELAIQFMEEREGKKRMSAEESARREKIYLQLKEAKHHFTKSTYYTECRTNND